MEMAGPLVHYKLGWKHFKCRCTWDQQTHIQGLFQALVTYSATTTTTTTVHNNEEQVVFLSINFFWGSEKLLETWSQYMCNTSND